MIKYSIRSNPPKKNSRNKLSFLLFLISLISIYACVSRQPVISPVSSENENKRIFEKVRKKWEGIRTVRGYFRITADIKGKQGSIKALLALTLPDNMRMELISPGGTTMAIMTLTHDWINLYYPSDNVLFTGKATTENIIKVLGLNLTPQEILPALMGKGFDLSKNPGKLLKDGNRLTAEYQSENGSARFSVMIDTEDTVVEGVKSYLATDSSLFAEIKYKDIVNKNDFAYPRVADLDFPNENSFYRIRITNVEFLVSSLEEKVFTVALRENAKIYRIDDIEIKGTLLFGEK